MFINILLLYLFLFIFLREPLIHALYVPESTELNMKKALTSLIVIALTAWLLWLFIHIFSLIGFKSKVFVFFQWLWSYISFKRGARLIVDKEWQMFGN